MNRTLCTLFAALTASLAPTAALAWDTWCDVDADGQVTAADVQLVQIAAMGKGCGGGTCDLDFDGHLDQDDVAAALDELAGAGSCALTGQGLRDAARAIAESGPKATVVVAFDDAEMPLTGVLGLPTKTERLIAGAPTMALDADGDGTIDSTWSAPIELAAMDLDADGDMDFFFRPAGGMDAGWPGIADELPRSGPATLAVVIPGGYSSGDFSKGGDFKGDGDVAVIIPGGYDTGDFSTLLVDLDGDGVMDVALRAAATR